MHRLWMFVALGLAAGACQKDDKKAARTGDASLTAQAQAAAGDGGVPRSPQKRVKHQVPPPMDLATPPADAEKLASGLVWKELTAGTGESPGANDGASVKYVGWKPDGTTFATTEPGTEPTTMWLYQTSPGFAEGVRKLKVGGKAIFWVPPELASVGKPRPNAEQQVFQVELVAIEKAPAAPADLKAPASAKTTKSGTKWASVKSAAAGAKKPRAWDALELTFTTWDQNGTILASTETTKRPSKAPLESLPPHLGEVLSQLAVGDRVRLWLPPDKAVAGPSKPTGDVVMEIEVTAVEELPEPPKTPEDVAAPPANAQKTPKGVFYKVLAAGKGGDKPTAEDAVVVHYSGWTTDGKRFDSSVVKGRPATFDVTGVIPGWTDALQQMTVGDRWRVWIPKELAYDKSPRGPQGMLVFDMELLEIKKGAAKAKQRKMPPTGAGGASPHGANPNGADPHGHP